MIGERITTVIVRTVLGQLRGISVEHLVLSILIVAILIHSLCLVLSRLHNHSIRWSKEILFILIAAYGCFILQVTLLNRAAGSRTGAFLAVDFGSIRGDFIDVERFICSILNILLLIPWGFLLTLLIQRNSIIVKMLMVTLYCFLTSCTIEVSQLVTHRGYFEVTDIITNTCGGALGCIFATVVIRALNTLLHRRRLNLVVKNKQGGSI